MPLQKESTCWKILSPLVNDKITGFLIVNIHQLQHTRPYQMHNHSIVGPWLSSFSSSILSPRWCLQCGANSRCPVQRNIVARQWSPAKLLHDLEEFDCGHHVRISNLTHRFYFQGSEPLNRKLEQRYRAETRTNSEFISHRTKDLQSDRAVASSARKKDRSSC